LYIESIKISGFRNIKGSESYRFINKKNLIYGSNGSGKTSIIEAIYVLGFGRSFLSVKKKELLSFDSDRFFIDSSLIRSGLKFNISAVMNNKFSLFLDEEKTTISGIGESFFPLFFSSNDYVQLIASKSNLRRLFDKLIFGVHSFYSDELIQYKKIIKNKSFLLKHNPEKQHLIGWNKLLAEYILNITKRRFGFVKEINDFLKKNYHKGIEVKYSPSTKEFTDDNDFNIGIVNNSLDELLEKEILYKNTLIGSHLDKYEIYLNKRPLRMFSSGEKKLNLLFIYLAYIELFLSVRKEYPVFLIDDYDIAMDESNKAMLMEKYPDMQIIATSVRKNKDFDNIIELKNPR